MSRDRRSAAQHPDRLTVVDEIFLRTHRGLGTPIALQGLWRTADHVDRALLAAVHSALRSGPLGRRVIRPAVPGARRRWQPTVRAHAFAYDERPIPVSALFDWADDLGYDLDPEFGPGWRLAATRLDDGGSLVSLTCSHALADGRALVIAADRAIGGAMRAGAVPMVGERGEQPDKHTDPLGERESDPVRAGGRIRTGQRVAVRPASSWSRRPHRAFRHGRIRTGPTRYGSGRSCWAAQRAPWAVASPGRRLPRRTECGPGGQRRKPPHPLRTARVAYPDSGNSAPGTGSADHTENHWYPTEHNHNRVTATVRVPRREDDGRTSPRT